MLSYDVSLFSMTIIGGNTLALMGFRHLFCRTCSMQVADPKNLHVR